MSQQEQARLSEYERKKPTFERHKALIVNILYTDPTAHGLQGLTDDQIAHRFETRLREERVRKGQTPCFGRKLPTVDNRLRELATENRIVRIKGFDGLKHNFHPDIFNKLSTNGLAKFFPEQELLHWNPKTGEPQQ